MSMHPPKDSAGDSSIVVNAWNWHSRMEHNAGPTSHEQFMLLKHKAPLPFVRTCASDRRGSFGFSTYQVIMYVSVIAEVPFLNLC